MCRKLIRTLVSLLLVCAILTVPAFAESAVITGSKVNVRSGPGTNYFAIVTLERNTVVDIVNRYDDLWYEVNYNGILGYVSSAYLSVSPSGSAGITVIEPVQSDTGGIGSVILPDVPASGSGISIVPDGTGGTGGSGSSSGTGGSSSPAPANTGGSKYYINAMYVRFRSGPGSTYSIVGEYNRGKEITVVTTVGDWVAGYIDGLPGYVHRNYVSKGSAPAAPTPTPSQGITLVPDATADPSLPQPDGGVTVVTPTAMPTPTPTPTPANVIVLPSPAATAAVTTPGANVNANGVKAYIVGTYVRFRTGPGTNYSIVGTYNTGKELTAYANVSNGWLFCSIDGKEGYVHGSYVYVVNTPSAGGASAAATPTPTQNVNITILTTEQPVISTNKTGYIIGNNVRFRAAASMTSQILKELFYGNQVTITGTAGEWSQVVYGGKVGYVYTKYVKEGAYASYDPGTSSTGTTVSSNAAGQDIVNFAGRYLGYKYRWGGISPETGFDCSGFVYYVFKHFGITVNRVASDQASNGVHVDAAAIQPGDILCFYSGSSYIGHVGIYIGNNKFIHASNSTTGVIISELSGYYATRGYEARRLVG